MTQREKIEEILLNHVLSTSKPQKRLSKAIDQIETLITKGKIEELVALDMYEPAKVHKYIEPRLKTLQASLKGKEDGK